MRKFRCTVIFQILLTALLFSCDAEFDTLKIIFCSPANNVTGVSADVTVEIGFSAGVNRTDVEDNFTLKNSDGSVTGRFQWLNAAGFRFTPETPLAKNGRYIIELPRDIRDDNGNIMESDFISEFYVGSDFTPPVVTSSTPALTSGASDGIAVNQSIIISFSKSMNRESVERGFSISPDVAGYFSWSEGTAGLANSRLTYTLLADMEYGKLYAFTVSASAEDSSGNPLAEDYKVNFITGNDFTPPRVEAIYDFSRPAVSWSASELNRNISRDVTIGITFSEGMDRQSVEKSFSLTPSVQGLFEWSSDSVVRFRPSEPLDPETKYQLSVNTSAKDRNGLKISSGFSVEIITDNPDSLYVKCGYVRGSNHDGDFAPLTGTWPLIIDMGAVIPVNKSYYIMISFFSDTAGPVMAVMDKYSIFDNILVETFKGADAGDSELPDSARIGSIEWTDVSTAKIRIDGMTNRSALQEPALYRLKIAGGENGIADTRGNYMKDDFVIEFREAIP